MISRRHLLASLPSLGLSATRKTNIVIVTADNIGYGDLGCYGNREILTPHLDRFAGQGIRFTNFYTASPSCTPSRAGLMTGRHPLRYGLNYQLNQVENQRGVGLPHSERILPSYLKPLGYRSGCFGKWNLGFGPGSRPTDRGFDEFLGMRSGYMDYFTHISKTEPDVFRGTQPFDTPKYSTDLFADAACEFLRASAKQPFFLYLPFNAAHYNSQANARPGETLPQWDAPDRYFDRYGWKRSIDDQRKRYRVVVTAMDDAFGRVLRQIDQLGLSSNTLVVFFSDNGAFMLKDRGLEVASNLPLREGGVTCWEGGIRVAGMARWPGRIPKGAECSELLSSMDLLPTAVAAAGGGMTGAVRPNEPDARLDGRDATSVLTGSGKSPHAALYFEWERQQALRSGPWKLIREKQKPWQLYRLPHDQGETTDVAAGHPDVVSELGAKFDAWRSSAAG